MEVAVLSRGYLRTSKGFTVVHPYDTTARTGDEPLLMAMALPQSGVFADRDRANGISEIIRLRPRTEMVLLDDGFQHRPVKAGLNIVLTGWNRLMTRDSLLPGGMLRESLSGLKRADIIIVTKTPGDTEQGEREAVRAELITAGAPEEIYFTTLAYREPAHLFSGRGRRITSETRLLLVTGIADPSPLVRYIEGVTSHTEHIKFPDHHKFTDSDIKRITRAFNDIAGNDKIILTTSKDGVRLKEIANIADHVRQALYYLPVDVQFIDNEDIFLNKIHSYAGKDNQDR